MDCIKISFFFLNASHNRSKEEKSKPVESSKGGVDEEQVNTIRAGGLIRQRKDKLTQEEVGFKIKLER